MRRLLAWVAVIALFVFWAFSDRFMPAPEKISAPTAIVRDGDTIVVADKTFRIYGIDAPEYHQSCTDKAGQPWPCGKAARLQLAALVTSGTIVCEPQAVDKYGRDVALCSSATTPDLGEAMVQAGLAISPAARGDAPYADAEAAAKQARRGIWQGTFEEPAQWRAAHPRTPVENSL